MTLREILSRIEIPDSDEIVAIDAIRSILISRLSLDSQLLVVVPNSRIGDLLISEITSISGSPVAEFPAWETLPHEKLSPKSDTVTKRLKLLNSLKNNPPKIIVTSIRGLIQPISKSVATTPTIKLKNGLELSLEELLRNLVHFGFTRTDLVERRGDFAVRGGIVDLFPPDQEHPIRVDFFGDEIDDLAYFTVSDQRTFEKLENLEVFPVRELLIDEKVKAKAQYLSNEWPQ